MKAFILTGSRDWTNKAALADVLFRRAQNYDLMIHGSNGIAPHATYMSPEPKKSADAMGAHLYLGWGAPIVPMPAQWDRHGKPAGSIRNGHMLTALLALRDCGYEVSVEAFSLPQSIGTAHMKRIAKAAGVTVNEHGRTA